jgi:hypothetical protein
MSSDYSPSEKLWIERAHAAEMARWSDRVAAERAALPHEPPTAAPAPPPDPHAGLDADARALPLCPRGTRYELLLISLLKYCLQDDKLSAGVRLQLLEQLNSLADDRTLAVVEPMDAISAQMLHTAMTLDGGKPEPPCPHFAMLTRQGVFSSFCKLNSTLLAGLKTMAPAR